MSTSLPQSILWKWLRRQHWTVPCLMHKSDSWHSADLQDIGELSFSLPIICRTPPTSSFPLYFSFFGFTYFLLLSIPSLSTRIVPLRFQAGGRRRRPNLGLVCVLFCNLCYLYSLVKMDCGVLFYLVSFCVFLQCFDTVGWVIRPVKTCPHMTYNVLVGR